MVAWSGGRKALTVLLFVAPTLIGVLTFSVYPILFNTYISFTNRNQFHPNPDCSLALTGLLEPTCWGVFKSAPTGVGQPFRLQDPLFANYTDLLGDLFTLPALLALLRLVICIAPLIIAWQVNRRLDKQVTRPLSSGPIWLAGLVGAIVLAWLLDAPGAYDTLTKTGDFIVVTLRTLLYVAVTMPIIFVVALTYALILNSPFIKARPFFRVVMFVPWAVSVVAIMFSLVWQFFFRQEGTINQLLAALGLKGPTWLNDPTLAFLVIVLVQVWYTYPFIMTIILGALQAISPDQYEAADVDGASWWQQLTRITLPLIRPAVLPAIVLSSITTFQLFGTVWAITQGGPSRGAGVPGATELVMVYAFKQVFQTSAYGRMGAYAVIMFLFLFALTLYSLHITRITKGAFES